MDEISNIKFSKLLEVIIYVLLELGLNTHCIMKLIYNSNKKKYLEYTNCIYFKN